MELRITPTSIYFGERFALNFQRTLRLPDDGRVYPLPPGLGPFPIYRVNDYLDNVPPVMREKGGVFIPMYQREAMWLAFEAASWKPNVAQIASGVINVLTGKTFAAGLHADPQDYIICPDQPWLDGFNAGEGIIRQFVAMPLGSGYSVEAQLSDRAEVGGLTVRVYEPRPGIFPDQPPVEPECERGAAGTYLPSPAATLMGMAAGGKMEQKIYPDKYGFATWDQENYGEVFIHLVNSFEFESITGEPPPPTPVDAAVYNDFRLPWFSLYDEMEKYIPAAGELKHIKSIQELDEARGKEGADASLKIDPQQVKKLGHKKPLK